jgi:vacuolar-type H+-ATPase subunit I/STV1
MAPTLMSEDKEELFVPVEESATQKEVQGNMEELLKQIADLREELNGLVEKAETKEDIQKAFSTVGEQIKALEEKLDEAMKTDEDEKKALEEVKTALASIEEEKKVLEEEKRSLAESLENSIKDREAKDAIIKSHQEELRQTNIEVFCKELSDKGIWPATVAVVKDVLVAGSGETVVTLSEGEGDEKKDVEIDLKGVITKIIESIPDEFKVSMGEDSEHGDNTQGEYTAEKIQQLAEKEGISYSEMVLKLSMEKKI